MQTATHHESKTLAGRPACAGSGITTPDISQTNACTVCGRSGFTVTPNQKMGTHIHQEDLVGGSTTLATKAVDRAIREIAFSLAQHAAIRTFSLDNNADNYAAMQTAGVLDKGTDYIAYARTMGWS